MSRTRYSKEWIEDRAIGTADAAGGMRENNLRSSRFSALPELGRQSNLQGLEPGF